MMHRAHHSSHVAIAVAIGIFKLLWQVDQIMYTLEQITPDLTTLLGE